MGDVLAFRRPGSANHAETRPSARRIARSDDRDTPRGRPVSTKPVAQPLWRELVGHELRTVRQQREQTLAQVGARAGVSVQYLSEIERGRKEPSSEVLAAVTGALDLTLLDMTAAVARQLRQPRRVGAGPAGHGSGPVALAA